MIKQNLILETSLLLFALAGGATALATPPNAQAASAAVRPSHSTQALPAALRPTLYQALAKDAGSAYRIGKDGCVSLPRQTLKACFDKHGAHFSGAGTSSLALHLVAYGRDEKLALVNPTRPASKGNQATYRHGVLSEWWRVLPMGFEQGFTITKRPSGHGELTLALTANRGAQAKGDGLAWGRLRYGGLVVTDARGRVIPATLKNKNNRILIAINDAHASYPLTVDPLVWLEQKGTASDGAADDDFGDSVALAGTTAIIGAPKATVGSNADQGAAYIFTESDGSWSESQKLTASDGAAGDDFGVSVALDGATAVVGAPGATVGGNPAQGAAYVFTASGGTWSESQKLIASDGAASDDFGVWVALDGATAIFGAYQATVGGNTAQGAAYVFTTSGGTWSESQKLIASDGAADDNFGIAVALAGTTAVIGANNATVGGNTGQGAAYVFTEAGGTWSESLKLTASDGAADDDFGYSVALGGTTAVIGAPGATVGGNAYQGAAYVFTEAGGTWSESWKLTASDGAADDLFGYPVALDGVTAVIGACAVFGPTAGIGAIFPTVGGNNKQGAAYVFTAAGGIWSESRKLTASDGAADDDFGYSVALDGTTAVIGAPYAIVGGNAKQGAAYFYGQSDLDLAVSAPAHVNPNDTYISQAIATNAASATSPAVAVSVAVPAAASFISASASQGSCSEASGVVTCNFGAINGNAGMATANVTLKATGSTGTTIENTASVAKATPPLTVSAATTIVSIKVGGGGTGWLTLLALLGLALTGACLKGRRN